MNFQCLYFGMMSPDEIVFFHFIYICRSGKKRGSISCENINVRECTKKTKQNKNLVFLLFQKFFLLENLLPLIHPLASQSLSVFVLYALVLKEYA